MNLTVGSVCPRITLTFAHVLENFKWNGWLKDQHVLSVGLDSAFSTESRVMFPLFPFFFSCAWTVISHGFTVQETKFTVHALFITVHSTIHTLKNIKNESYGTIHIFKNYFATVLSVFNFQFSVFSFSNNKFNPNRPLIRTQF